jgi:flagellar basal body-associated protein FliL
MQAKANGKQILWVLLIALVLIALCIGGLWTYVIGAKTDTGIQEAFAAELSEE